MSQAAFQADDHTCFIVIELRLDLSCRGKIWYSILGMYFRKKPSTQLNGASFDVKVQKKGLHAVSPKISPRRIIISL